MTTEVIEHYSEPEYVEVEVDPNIFYTTLDKNLKVPVFEAEDGGGVYGYGHIEPRLFAAIVNLYDLALTGGTEYEPYTEDDVSHGSAIPKKREDMLDDDYFRFNYHGIDPNAGFAFPITYIER